MSRETKVGLVVASAFLCLVGVVLASKLREGEDVHAEIATAGPPRAALTPVKPKPAPAASEKPSVPTPPAAEKPPQPEPPPVQVASAEGTGGKNKSVGPVPPPVEEDPVLKASRLPAGKEKTTDPVPPPAATGPTTDPLLPPPLPAVPDSKNPPADKKDPVPPEGADTKKTDNKEDSKDIERLLAEQKKKSTEKTEQPPLTLPAPEGALAKETEPKKETEPTTALPALPPGNPATGSASPPAGPTGETGTSLPALPATGPNREKKEKVVPPVVQAPLPPLGSDAKPVVRGDPLPGTNLPPLPEKGKPLDPGQTGAPLTRGVAVPVGPLTEKGPEMTSTGPAAPIPPLPPAAEGANRGTTGPRSLPDIGSVPLGSAPVVGSRPIAVPASVAAAPARVDSFDLEMHRAAPGDTFTTISQRYYNSDKYARALVQFNRDYQQGGADLRGEAPALAAGQTVLIPTLDALERRYGALIPDYRPVAAQASPAAAVAPNVAAAAPASLGKPIPAVAPVVPAAAWAQPAIPTRPYRVEGANEMLYTIAKRELGDANRWSEIYRLNPAVSPEQPVPANTVLRLPAPPQAAPGKPAPAEKTDLPSVGRVGYTPPSLVDGPVSQP